MINLGSPSTAAGTAQVAALASASALLFIVAIAAALRRCNTGSSPYILRLVVASWCALAIIVSTNVFIVSNTTSIVSTSPQPYPVFQSTPASVVLIVAGFTTSTLLLALFSARLRAVLGLEAVALHHLAVGIPTSIVFFGFVLSISRLGSMLTAPKATAPATLSGAFDMTGMGDDINDYIREAIFIIIEAVFSLASMVIFVHKIIQKPLTEWRAQYDQQMYETWSKKTASTLTVSDDVKGDKDDTFTTTTSTDTMKLVGNTNLGSHAPSTQSVKRGSVSTSHKLWKVVENVDKYHSTRTTLEDLNSHDASNADTNPQKTRINTGDDEDDEFVYDDDMIVLWQCISHVMGAVSLRQLTYIVAVGIVNLLQICIAIAFLSNAGSGFGNATDCLRIIAYASELAVLSTLRIERDHKPVRVKGTAVPTSPRSTATAPQKPPRVNLKAFREDLHTGFKDHVGNKNGFVDATGNDTKNRQKANDYSIKQ